MGKTPTMTNKIKTYRHRPFLIVEYWYTPTKQARTHIKGWMDVEGNVQTNENPYVADSLNLRHITTASVIIDLLKKEVVKNRFSTTSDEDIITHYTQKFATQINEAVSIWMRRERLTNNEQVSNYVQQPVDQMAIPEGGMTVTMV